MSAPTFTLLALSSLVLELSRDCQLSDYSQSILVDISDVLRRWVQYEEDERFQEFARTREQEGAG